MQTLSTNPVTKISQIESQIAELKLNQTRLSNQANQAKQNASSLMDEAEKKEIQSKEIDKQLSSLESELKGAQSELSRKQRKELENYKVRSKSLVNRAKRYNSDLEHLIQEICSLNAEAKELSLIHQRLGLSEPPNQPINLDGTRIAARFDGAPKVVLGDKNFRITLG